MKHLAAFALLVLGGNEKPSAADVEKLLKDAGVKADSEKIEKMIAAFEGKNFQEMVAGGLAKMATMGSAGPSAPVAAAAAAPVEEKKEEVEEVDMGGLFGGDDDDY
eukprot:CAMPEP_0168607544 /NCGR_PEP_ID=MMETSP0449_2-20121227/110_1 /TAXON_ID=1082188 /ORGANISM="Strombidium rassoulzadegani, Strain ras09" /LENGTH=105 /DNA_ID=CAMNT_0008647389 /DNA_START=54 /DNA_END=371 /DNA_ORIENTATION=-